MSVLALYPAISFLFHLDFSFNGIIFQSICLLLEYVCCVLEFHIFRSSFDREQFNYSISSCLSCTIRACDPAAVCAALVYDIDIKIDYRMALISDGTVIIIY